MDRRTLRAEALPSSRARAGEAVLGLAAAAAVVVLVVHLLRWGGWEDVLGFTAALAVVVPLFWLLNHPRRRRRPRLRIVAEDEPARPRRPARRPG